MLLIVGIKELDPVIQFALIAHHTPNIISCNDMSWMKTGFSAAQYILFLEFTYPPSFNVPENEDVLCFFSPHTI